MKQILTTAFLFCCMAVVAPLCAQPETVQATVTAGASSEHLYVAIGQTFFTQEILSDYEFAMGVAQAQWVRDTVYDVITFNTPYTKHGFNLAPQTDSHQDSVYLVNGGIYHYDLRRTLYLIICPEKLADNYSNTYDVLAVSGHCWTKQNLRSPIDGAMTYTSAQNPTVPESYGLLYTWNTALNNTAPDADGYVQGICPAQNWHLPDAIEIADLHTNPTEALRSTEGWLQPNANTNSTGFTAYPAGLFNATTARFEGLGYQTDWWTATGTMMDETISGAAETLHATSLQINYFCDTPRISPRNPNDAVSVRCVMKNEWPE
jgi:uncharacterized protein (TIGR02145 family)